MRQLRVVQLSLTKASVHMLSLGLLQRRSGWNSWHPHKTDAVRL